MINNQQRKGLTPRQLEQINSLLDKVSIRQKKDFGNINSDIKADGTLITDCDRWSDMTLVNGIQNIIPGEGILSEEGSKIIPNSLAYWIIDPLDGTTNFAAGIPYWAISVARFVKGEPETAFLDIPSLNKRIIAIKDKGVWINGKEITKEKKYSSNSECVSLCSRSIRILQKKPNKPFPGKIRLLGVASLNMVSVAFGQTIAALEATPKIWDLASSWLILKELGCPIKWLAKKPSILESGEDLTTISFPLLTACSKKELDRFLPWADALIEK